MMLGFIYFPLQELIDDHVTKFTLTYVLHPKHRPFN